MVKQLLQIAYDSFRGHQNAVGLKYLKKALDELEAKEPKEHFASVTKAEKKKVIKEKKEQEE